MSLRRAPSLRSPPSPRRRWRRMPPRRPRSLPTKRRRWGRTHPRNPRPVARIPRGAVPRVPKKRVHEIAKQQGLSSKEVLAALNAAGIEAKVAASSVEESDALKALKTAGADGAQAASKPVAEDPAKGSPATKQPAAPKPGSSASGGSASGRKRRRVVIDSQASRRDHMPQAPPHRPPRRRGGRRRRPLLEEPVAKAPETEVEPEATKVQSGATVGEVAETLDLGSAELIKKLMELGEMATLTQTLPDETITALAKALDQKIEIVRSTEEPVAEPEYEDA